MSKLKILGLICVICSTIAATAPQGGDLRRRADALNALYSLNLPADQLHQLSKLATGAAMKETHARLGPNLHKALMELCEALAKSDDEHIDALQKKVDQLEENNNATDPGIEQTETARARAPEAMRMLTTKELANFIGNSSDEIQGPAEALIASMDDQRGDSDDDFANDQADAAKECVELSKGFAGDKQLYDQAAALLLKAHKMNDADFKSAHADLSVEAHKICGKPDPFIVMRNWTLLQMADLLSNPELQPAIEMRLANPKPATQK